MTDGEWEHIKKIFRYTGDKPTNKAELKPIIIKIIKSITDDKIIESKQVMINKIKQRQTKRAILIDISKFKTVS